MELPDIDFMLEIPSEEKRMSISRSETKNEGGFQTEEGTTKSKFTMHVGEPIEPSTSLTFLSSGTSKGATEEPFLSKSSKLVELPESETTPISLEKQELLSAHGTDVMEKKGKMSIPETEIEIVPSQPTEEGQMNFQLTKHVGIQLNHYGRKKHSIYGAYVTPSHMDGVWDPSLCEKGITYSQYLRSLPFREGVLLFPSFIKFHHHSYILYKIKIQIRDNIELLVLHFY